MQSWYKAQKEAGMQGEPNTGECFKFLVEQLKPLSFHTFQLAAPLPPQQKTGGLFSLFLVFIFERERERETQNLNQAAGSELSAQSMMRGLNS